ncbi:hypothetical protein [Streptomyces sp. NPDC093261]|uniref:hypothetical protein n=1 Tax=Streptomyces sp. NPDC093261 TaxID=3366037 RepID=UPI003803DC8D
MSYKTDLGDIRSHEPEDEERRKAGKWAIGQVLDLCADPDNPTETERELMSELLKALGLKPDEQRVVRDPLTKPGRDATGRFHKEAP